MALATEMAKSMKRSALLSRYGAILMGFVRLQSDIFRSIRAYKITFKIMLPPSPKRGKTVLLAGSVGMNPDNFLQHLLGMGLDSIGANVYVLSCDGILKACFNCKFQHYQSRYLRAALARSGPGLMCRLCRSKGRRYLKNSELQNLQLSEYICNEDLIEAKRLSEDCLTVDDIRQCVDRGVNVGEHAHAGVIRFFAAPDLEKEEDGVELAQAYLYSSILASRATTRLFETLKFDAVVLDHGIYVPQGVIAEISLSRGISTHTFATGYRKHSFIFANGGSYHYVIPQLGEGVLTHITKEQKQIAKEYVESRTSGKNDWVLFQEKTRAISESEFGVMAGKKNVAIFTNVLWDAQIHFGDAIFPDSLTWLCETIEFLRHETDVNVILRIHPGEIKGFVKSRVGVEEKLRERLSEDTLRWLTIISANSPVNSYELARRVDFSVVDGSKIGIDLCALGLPVVVGGDCWTKGKGISIDAKTKVEYFGNLERGLSQGFNDVDQERALAFAYFIYFDRMKEIPFVNKVAGDPPFALAPKPVDSDINDFSLLVEELL